MSPRTLFLSKLIGLYCILVALSHDHPPTSDSGVGTSTSSRSINAYNAHAAA